MPSHHFCLCGISFNENETHDTCTENVLIKCPSKEIIFLFKDLISINYQVLVKETKSKARAPGVVGCLPFKKVPLHVK